MTDRARVTPVFIVHHTHWDREWYETAHRSRQWLVPLVDGLLDLLERDPGAGPFLLDGQEAVIEDYLGLRPDQRARMARMAAAGRLLTGPWYVLADEILSSDEVLVRNLLAGRAVGSELGSWLPVGYSPDAFGHPAALPTILAGFGIRFAIVWRGYGGEPGQEGDLFRWFAPDGSTVLTHHLPQTGYEFGVGLAPDEHLEGRWRGLRHAMVQRAKGRALLLMCGADHHGPQYDLSETVTLLNVLDTGRTFRVASPVEYFEQVAGAESLPAVRGELRFSYHYAWTLQGVHATHGRLKTVMAEAERLLVRWAEPQCALAWISGGRDRSAELGAAWRDHLRSCAHDSFGGCCTDAVARDVIHRAGVVVSSARSLLSDAVRDRVGFSASLARRDPSQWRPALLVINPSSSPRSAVVEATVTTFAADVPVGMGSPSSAVPKHPGPGPIPRLTRPEGDDLPVQVLGRYLGYDRLDSPARYPDQDVVYATRIAVAVDAVPSLGVMGLGLSVGRGMRGLLGRGVEGTPSSLQSDWCRVMASGPRGFRVRTTRPGWHLRGVGSVESERDVGDTYTFQPVSNDRAKRARWGRSSVVWEGPLIACVSRPFEIPGRVRGTAYVRLVAGEHLVHFIIEGENLTGDHRVRVTVPTPSGRLLGVTIADMQYGPQRRVRREYDPADYPLEWPVTTAPMHRYVSVPHAGGTGMTVMARGLFEYELLADGRLAVTLFRSVGELSLGDLPARPGHAGWPAPTPEAQELGPFRREFAITPLACDLDDPPSAWASLERCVEAFHAPLAGQMLRANLHPHPHAEGPTLEGAGLVLKSVKQADDGDGIILRCVNVTNHPVRGAWVWPGPLRDAVRVALGESPDESRQCHRTGSRIEFDAAPREVVTLRLLV
jgi:2-O-(6-phospho-alpha-D-mannosyl)-D-glycerate hydrolase